MPKIKNTKYNYPLDPSRRFGSSENTTLLRGLKRTAGIGLVKIDC
jgi:hypothetical protein